MASSIKGVDEPISSPGVGKSDSSWMCVLGEGVGGVENQIAIPVYAEIIGVSSVDKS